MARIGRSFDELDQKVKALNTSIKDTDKTVKDLDKNIKINPGNVDAVRQKYTALSRNVQQTSEKLELLKQRQQALTNDFNAGNISQDTYNRQLASTARQVDQTTAELERLNKQLQDQNKAIRDASFTKMTTGLNGVKSVADKASKAVLAVTVALAALMKNAIDTGDELSDTANKYKTSVEGLQLWSNRLALLASDTEAYTSALRQIGSIQTSIVAGRGARYLNYLNQLGIAQEDLNNKTNSEVFDLIYSRLRNVTDATQRATIAQGILGDGGLEIAIIAGTAQEEIDKLDRQLIENGIITSEQAAVADEAANKLQNLKTQYNAAAAEILVSLQPAFEALVKLLQVSVIPILTKLADAFAAMSPEQQKSLLFTAGLLIVLPKIIGLIAGIVTVMKTLNTMKAIHTAVTASQTAAVTALDAAATPWLGIITAISMALLLLIKIIDMFIGKSSEAVDSANVMLKSINGLDDKLNDMGYDIETDAETTYDVNNNKTLNINLDVSATGDGTPIGEDNAEVVANALEDKILTDLINQGLGSVIR